MRRAPDQHTSPILLTPVGTAFVPATAQERLEDRRLAVRLGHVVRGDRPPSVLLDEQGEGLDQWQGHDDHLEHAQLGLNGHWLSFLPRGGGELERPEGMRPVRIHELAQQRQPVGIETVQAAIAVSVVADQAGLLQDAQVHRNCWATNGQAAREIADSAWAVGESLEDAPTGSLAERRESSLSSVSLH